MRSGGIAPCSDLERGVTQDAGVIRLIVQVQTRKREYARLKNAYCFNVDVGQDFLHVILCRTIVLYN